MPIFLGYQDFDVVEPFVRVEAALAGHLAHPRDIAGPAVVARKGKQRAIRLAEFRVQRNTWS
jgi:hypothetical protein